MHQVGNQYIDEIKLLANKVILYSTRIEQDWRDTTTSSYICIWKSQDVCLCTLVWNTDRCPAKGGGYPPPHFRIVLTTFASPLERQGLINQHAERVTKNTVTMP